LIDLRKRLREELGRSASPDLWPSIEARVEVRSSPAPGLRSQRMVAAALGLVILVGLGIGFSFVLRNRTTPAASRCAVVQTLPGLTNASLFAVETLRSDDVWAVGRSGSAGLIERFDGTSWKPVDHPDAGGELTGVAVLSDTDVWVVGHDLLHYDGSRWRVFQPPPPPAPGDVVAGFNDVTAIAPDDVWAAGTEVTVSGHTRGIVAHWNGGAWSIVDTPATNSGWSSALQAIDARSRDDIWAVGARGTGSAPAVGDAALALHWNGSRWAVVPIGADGTLYDIAVVGRDAAWAVGEARGTPLGQSVSVIERWNGTRWRAFPHHIGQAVVLHGVSASSPTDVWAVGGRVVVHFDGSRWTRAAALRGGSDLLGVVATPRAATAVGERSPEGSGLVSALIARYCSP